MKVPGPWVTTQLQQCILSVPVQGERVCIAKLQRVHMAGHGPGTQKACHRTLSHARCQSTACGVQYGCRRSPGNGLHNSVFGPRGNEMLVTQRHSNGLILRDLYLRSWLANKNVSRSDLLRKSFTLRVVVAISQQRQFSGLR